MHHPIDRCVVSRLSEDGVEGACWWHHHVCLSMIVNAASLTCTSTTRKLKICACNGNACSRLQLSLVSCSQSQLLWCCATARLACSAPALIELHHWHDGSKQTWVHVWR